MIVENKNIFYHALRNLIISIIRDELSEMNNFRKKKMEEKGSRASFIIIIILTVSRILIFGLLVTIVTRF